MNVLIVDDEIRQVKSIGRGLRAKGFSVLDACDVETALQQLEQHVAVIDLVITDYAMPGLNGLDLVSIIRARYPALPVIVISAYHSEGLLVNVNQYRCESFLAKPFTLDQLLQEITRIFTLNEGKTMKQPIRILLVEDEILTAMRLELEMKKYGYTKIQSVPTGEEAIRAAQQEAPDLILMDIRLAGDLDGIETMQEIHTFARIPVIFMSGYSDREQLQRANALLPAAYLTKPVNIADLTAAIDSAVA
jgi:CheY-like chemotaxis protein